MVVRKSLIWSALFASISGLTACGGGASSGSSGGGNGGNDKPATNVQMSGAVVDGYIINALVCLDLNNNTECDTEEPQAITLANGTYQLPLTDTHRNHANFDSAKIMVIGGKDSDTGKAVTGKLQASQTTAIITTDSNIENRQINVTAITTLIAKTGNAEKVKQALGLNSDFEIGADPIALAKAATTPEEKAKAKTFIAQTIAFNRSIETLITAAQKGNPSDKEDQLTEQVFNALTNVIEEQINDTTVTQDNAVSEWVKRLDKVTSLPDTMQNASEVAAVSANESMKILTDNSFDPSQDDQLQNASLQTTAITQAIDKKINDGSIDLSQKVTDTTVAKQAAEEAKNTTSPQLAYSINEKVDFSQVPANDLQTFNTLNMSSLSGEMTLIKIRDFAGVPATVKAAIDNRVVFNSANALMIQTLEQEGFTTSMFSEADLAALREVDATPLLDGDKMNLQNIVNLPGMPPAVKNAIASKAANNALLDAIQQQNITLTEEERTAIQQLDATTLNNDYSLDKIQTLSGLPTSVKTKLTRSAANQALQKALNQLGVIVLTEDAIAIEQLDATVLNNDYSIESILTLSGLPSSITSQLGIKQKNQQAIAAVEALGIALTTEEKNAMMALDTSTLNEDYSPTSLLTLNLPINVSNQLTIKAKNQQVINALKNLGITLSEADKTAIMALDATSLNDDYSVEAMQNLAGLPSSAKAEVDRLVENNKLIAAFSQFHITLTTSEITTLKTLDAQTLSNDFSTTSIKSLSGLPSSLVSKIENYEANLSMVSAIEAVGISPTSAERTTLLQLAGSSLNGDYNLTNIMALSGVPSNIMDQLTVKQKNLEAIAAIEALGITLSQNDKDTIMSLNASGLNGDYSASKLATLSGLPTAIVNQLTIKTKNQEAIAAIEALSITVSSADKDTIMSLDASVLAGDYSPTKLLTLTGLPSSLTAPLTVKQKNLEAIAAIEALGITVSAADKDTIMSLDATVLSDDYSPTKLLTLSGLPSSLTAPLTIKQKNLEAIAAIEALGITISSADKATLMGLDATSLNDNYSATSLLTLTGLPASLSSSLTVKSKNEAVISAIEDLGISVSVGDKTTILGLDATSLNNDYSPASLLTLSGLPSGLISSLNIKAKNAEAIAAIEALGITVSSADKDAMMSLDASVLGGDYSPTKLLTLTGLPNALISPLTIKKNNLEAIAAIEALGITVSSTDKAAMMLLDASVLGGDYSPTKLLTLTGLPNALISPLTIKEKNLEAIAAIEALGITISAADKDTIMSLSATILGGDYSPTKLLTLPGLPSSLVAPLTVKQKNQEAITAITDLGISLTQAEKDTLMGLDATALNDDYSPSSLLTLSGLPSSLVSPLTIKDKNLDTINAITALGINLSEAEKSAIMELDGTALGGDYSISSLLTLTGMPTSVKTQLETLQQQAQDATELAGKYVRMTQAYQMAGTVDTPEAQTMARIIDNPVVTNITGTNSQSMAISSPPAGYVKVNQLLTVAQQSGRIPFINIIWDSTSGAYPSSSISAKILSGFTVDVTSSPLLPPKVADDDNYVMETFHDSGFIPLYKDTVTGKSVYHRQIVEKVVNQVAGNTDGENLRIMTSRTDTLIPHHPTGSTPATVLDTETYGSVMWTTAFPNGNSQNVTNAIMFKNTLDTGRFNISSSSFDQLSSTRNQQQHQVYGMNTSGILFSFDGEAHNINNLNSQNASYTSGTTDVELQSLDNASTRKFVFTPDGMFGMWNTHHTLNNQNPEESLNCYNPSFSLDEKDKISQCQLGSRMLVKLPKAADKTQAQIIDALDGLTYEFYGQQFKSNTNQTKFVQTTGKLEITFGKDSGKLTMQWNSSTGHDAKQSLNSDGQFLGLNINGFFGNHSLEDGAYLETEHSVNNVRLGEFELKRTKVGVNGNPDTADNGTVFRLFTSADSTGANGDADTAPDLIIGSAYEEISIGAEKDRSIWVIIGRKKPE